MARGGVNHRQHILRLQVGVHNAAAVDEAQRRQDLAAVEPHLVQRKALRPVMARRHGALQAVKERLATQLQQNAEDAAAGHAQHKGVVQLHHVGLGGALDGAGRRPRQPPQRQHLGL